jgi:hypothetical protein
VAGPNFAHTHELDVDRDAGRLIVATHDGLYDLTVQAGGNATAAGPVGGLDFDPMGFTIANGVAYASGHPGPTTPDTFGSPNLGLITSSDGGETWINVSLTDEVDFHGLAVVAGVGEARVFGLDSGRQLLQVSLDGGTTWADGAELVARDLLAVGERLYATTPDGLVASDDNGATFTVVAGAPPLFLVAADTSGALAGVDTSGTIWRTDAGGSWMAGGTVSGTPQALDVEGDRIYVADDRGIAFTDDAGGTWTVVSLQAG